MAYSMMYHYGVRSLLFGAFLLFTWLKLSSSANELHFTFMSNVFPRKFSSWCQTTTKQQTKNLASKSLCMLSLNADNNYKKNELGLPKTPYHEVYLQSLSSQANFWGSLSKSIQWFREPASEDILTNDENHIGRWFKGGLMNTAYIALDYHVENGSGDTNAIIWESPVTKQRVEVSYQELRDEVAKFAGVLQAQGIGKGDTVMIYMPMHWKVAVAMLACARLGAIHCVVFGGFAAKELAVRIDDVKPKLMLTANYGMNFYDVVEYKPLVDQALEMSEFPPKKTIVFQRKEKAVECKMTEGVDFDWDEMVSLHGTPVDAVPVDATDPLYVMYTSGTTGKPKGIVRDNGGHAVALKWSMKNIYDCDPGDVFWAASDVGWVVGHSYIVYGPLFHGCTSILFEGKPVRTPDPGTIWRIISENKVKSFFTAPTTIRAVKKEDSEGKFLQKYDISCLKRLFLAGERTDPSTLNWLEEVVPGVPVLDHWWQTETAWAISANPAGLSLLPVKPGSACVPMPGYDLHVLDDDGNRLKAGEEGNIVIKLPLPPSCFPTIWKNHQMVVDKYFSKYPGYYLTGDYGYLDNDGYVFVMGRIDDVINTAAHRLSSGQMEEIIAGHEAVAECAVIGVKDELRGEVPIAFVVEKDSVHVEEPILRKELRDRVQDAIGQVSAFKSTLIIKQLPKTKSGKILRGTIKQLAENLQDDIPVPSTIDNPETLLFVIEALKKNRIGIYSKK